MRTKTIIPSDNPAPGKRLAWLWFSLALFFLMLFFKLPSLLSQSHTETDERIYLALASNLRLNGRYSLQGTPVLSHLSPGMYDKPLFHHPPLYPLLIIPFTAAFSPQAAVVVSWLGHFLVVLAVLLVLRRALGPGKSPLILLVAALAAFDPLMFFVSQKIWLDSMLAGLTALSAALFFLATEAETPARGTGWAMAAGAAFGLAVLVKLPAAVMAPLFVALYLRKHAWNARLLARYFVPFAVPAALLTAPWFIAFYRTYHVLVPGWVAPDAWLISRNRFIRMVMDRPPYYFFKEFFLLAPVLALPFLLRVFLPRLTAATRLERVMGGAELYVLLVFTGLAAFLSYTYQMRMVAMASAPAYICLGLALDRADALRRPVLSALCLAGFAVNAATCFLCLLNYGPAEISSLAERLLGMR